MILLKNIFKNLLVIFRNKSSALITVFGPLILILIIGLAFTSSPNNKLSVGVHTPEKTELAERFINNLGDEGFFIERFDNVESCIKSIKAGSTQACISFPKDFVIRNNKTNNITFYVDNSRINLVYEIIGHVSENIDVETSEISNDLAKRVIAILTKTGNGIDAAIGKTALLKQHGNQINSLSDELVSDLESIDLGEVSFSDDDLETQFELSKSLIDDYKVESRKIIRKARDFFGSVNSSVDVSDLKKAVNDFESFVNSSDDSVSFFSDGFSQALNNLRSAIDLFNNKLSSASSQRDDVVENIGSIRDEVDSLESDVDSLKSDLQLLVDRINDLKVTSSKTISNPVRVNIEEVVSHKNRLAIVFPYLLILVIMFIGLILPSTMIVVDKQSKASFRTFTTPVRDWVFMMGYFITSFIIISLQVILVSAIAYLFIGSVLFNNFGVSLLIVLLSMVFFIWFGMIIGYLVSTQEGVVIISVSLASIMFFVSNLVIPLETFPRNIQFLLSLNPYYFASEALRMNLILSVAFDEIKKHVYYLLAYGLISILLTVFINKVSKSRLLIGFSIRKQKNLIKEVSDIYLQVGNVFIKDPDEFLVWLRNVSDEEFHRELSLKELKKWLRKKHKKRILSLLAHKKSREGLIRVFERGLRK